MSVEQPSRLPCPHSWGHACTGHGNGSLSMTKRIAGIALGVLLVNSAYIAAFPQPSIFYMGNVLLHLGLGLGLMVLALWWARRHPVECGAFLLAGLPALFLTVRGNTMDHRWALWLHILLAVIAAGVVGLRLFRAARPPAWKLALVAVLAALELGPAGGGVYHRGHAADSDQDEPGGR